MRMPTGRAALVQAAVAAVILFTGVSVAQADSGPAHRAWQARPISLGTSGSNIFDIVNNVCYGGTLGSLVKDTGGTQYVLSNNHILARINKGAAGEPIVQPGLIEAGCAQYPTNTVANLSQWIPLQFKSKGPAPLNAADAAIAAVATVNGAPAVRTDGGILDIGVLSNLTTSPTVGCTVKKSGRTTGLTRGSVASTEVTIDVSYSNGATARFTGQFLVSPGDFSGAGDSGSLVVRDVASTPRAVGLFFARNSKYAIASPIDNALTALKVSMVGVGETDPANAPCPGAAAAPAATANAKAAKARHADALMSHAGVVGVGVGAGPAIEVYLAHENAAARSALPAALDGVPVRAVVTGEFIAR